MSAWRYIAHTKVSGSSAANIVFSSIPNNFTDLLLVFSLRSTSTDGGQGWTGATLSINGTSIITNFSGKRFYGTGSGAGTDSGEPYFGSVVGSISTANVFGNGQIYIPNYTSGSAKFFIVDTVTSNNSTSALSMLNAVRWGNSAAISSLSLAAATGNLDVNSSATLYGITAGSSAGVTVS